MRSTVRNAAKLAVYDDISINVKNHQTEPTMRPDMERGDRSQPCCMNAPNANQNEFSILNSLTAELGPARCGGIRLTDLPRNKKWNDFELKYGLLAFE